MMSVVHSSRIAVITAIAALAVALAGCNSTPTPPPAAIGTLVAQTAVLPTLIPTATLPVAPTDTPEPTDTPAPEPTATSRPTASPPPAPTAVATVNTVPTPAQAAAADALMQAFAKLKTAYPYRLTEESTNGGQPLDRVTDFAAADRWHTTWNTFQPSNITEEIGIGDQLYWLVRGRWEGGSRGQPPGAQSADVMTILLTGLRDVQYAGQETVNGVPCFVFTYNLKLAGSTPVTGSGKGWVGISDGLPHQLDAEGAAMGYPFRSHLVYSYGVMFDIQPPM